MTNKLTLSVLILCSMLSLTAGCTNNTKARLLGGALDVTLPANAKIINVTWKDANLWVLTRPMKSNEPAETLTFREFPEWGTWAGTVTIHEIK